MTKFPGKINVNLEKALRHFRTHGVDKKWNIFDFPEYADIPVNISFRLSPDDVDYIQENWNEIRKW